MFIKQFLHSAVLLGLCSMLASCVYVPSSPLSGKNLSNEGTLCLLGQEDYNIKVYYLPLNTTCASSSLHRWSNPRLAAVLTQQRGKDDVIRVDSFIHHVSNDSPVATADCAGANIQTAQLAVNSYRNFDVFWGTRKIGTMGNSDGAILCRKVDATGRISAVPELHEEIRSMAKMDVFFGR